MINTRLLDDLAKRLAAAVPPGANALRRDLEQQFSAMLQAHLGKLDLVTRDQFDAQRAVLERTRAKVESLEQQLAALEATHDKQ